MRSIVASAWQSSNLQQILGHLPRLARALLQDP
jgi:hypothetical protein